jgi:hypothetical protein
MVAVHESKQPRMPTARRRQRVPDLSTKASPVDRAARSSLTSLPRIRYTDFICRHRPQPRASRASVRGFAPKGRSIVLNLNYFISLSVIPSKARCLSGREPVRRSVQREHLFDHAKAQGEPRAGTRGLRGTLDSQPTASAGRTLPVCNRELGNRYRLGANVSSGPTLYHRRSGPIFTNAGYGSLRRRQWPT